MISRFDLSFKIAADMGDSSLAALVQNDRRAQAPPAAAVPLRRGRRYRPARRFPQAAGLVRGLRGLDCRARANPRAENDHQMEARLAAASRVGPDALAAGGVTMICTGDSSTPKGSQNDKQG